MESSREVKKIHDPGFEVATQSEGSLQRVICNFPDGTIGVFEINERTSIWGPGHFSYSGQLKILQSTPLKLLKTYAVDLTKKDYQGLLQVPRPPPSVELIMVNNTVLIILNEVNRCKQLFILDITGNVLAANPNNTDTPPTDQRFRNPTHSIVLNHSCFAVPVWHYQNDVPQCKIYIYALKEGALKILNTLYLTQDHHDFSATGERKDDIESKKQAKALPLDVTKICRLERLTDEEFIIHGEDGWHRQIVLKCNFVNSTVTKLFSPPFKEAAIRVMNPKLLLCVGQVRGGDRVSQLWQIEENKEVKEKEQKEEAVMKLEEAIEDTRALYANLIYDSVQCLPEQSGFYFQLNCPPHLGYFIHLFRSKRVVPVHMPDDIHLLSMTLSCMVYSNKVVNKKKHSFTHLYEIPLNRLIREHKPEVIKEIRARFQTHYVLSKFALFPSQLCAVVNDYADEIPSWTKTLVPKEMLAFTPTDLFFEILKDKKYFSGGCADQMRALIALVNKSDGSMLQELKGVAEKIGAKGVLYLLFSRDTMSDREKIIFRLLKEINSFNDLVASPHFDELQDDWCRYRQSVSCRIT